MTETPTPTTADEIHDILRGTLTISPDQQLNDDTTLASLGADSLDVIEIEMMLEDWFDVTVPDDQISLTTTMGELVALVSPK